MHSIQLIKHFNYICNCFLCSLRTIYSYIFISTIEIIFEYKVKRHWSVEKEPLSLSKSYATKNGFRMNCIGERRKTNWLNMTILWANGWQILAKCSSTEQPWLWKLNGEAGNKCQINKSTIFVPLHALNIHGQFNMGLVDWELNNGTGSNW